MTDGAAETRARRDHLREHLREVPAFRALVRGVECRLFERAGALTWPVLDVGCGDGHFAANAFARPLSVGVDADASSLAEARARGAHEWVAHASATRLPFAAETFETVVANCVVEHIPDLDAALAEIRRVLRPSGRFLFGVPSHRFADLLMAPTVLRALRLRRLADAYGRWFNRHSRHFHTYDPPSWHARLARHGFRVENWEYYIAPAGHRAFDLAHYLSVPRLVSRKLTGRWVAFPNPVTNYLFERWLRPHYEAPAPDEGAYIFFHARKADDDSLSGLPGTLPLV